MFTLHTCMKICDKVYRFYLSLFSLLFYSSEQGIRAEQSKDESEDCESRLSSRAAKPTSSPATLTLGISRKAKLVQPV